MVRGLELLRVARNPSGFPQWLLLYLRARVKRARAVSSHVSAIVASETQPLVFASVVLDRV